MKINGKRPNFLIITTDEQRFPPPYENPEAKAYRLKNSECLAQMLSQGIEFTNHTAASTACAPSRTSIYTGQYPSLHGVSQTPGIGKSSFDQNMFWLETNTVPTMGSWFRKAGYQTFYRGKWHLSHEDIDIPGTQTSLLSNSVTGEPYPERIDLYAKANRLDKHGFDAWVGPEPHGPLESNTGMVRDPGFASQVCRTLEMLDEAAKSGEEQEPFLLVSSFLNPHDIVFTGNSQWFSHFEEKKDNGDLPRVTPAPTQDESLVDKPRCQKDYLYTYPAMIIPQPANESYRQFYYYLMAEVNKHVAKVYDTLKETRFFENTIVVFTSDHGEMLGAHGGLHQKWYTAYQEVLHVPFIVSNPVLFDKPGELDLTTSHIDLLPTLLGLAGADVQSIRKELAKDHSEAHPLVGRDLSKVLLNEEDAEDQPVYFMTNDNVEVGADMTNLLTGVAYKSVIQPNAIEAVITKLPALSKDTRWKYVRYFDNLRYSGGQGALASLTGSQNAAGNLAGAGNQDEVTTSRFIPSEYECYNLTDDPTEQNNLLSPLCSDPLSKDIHLALKVVLKEQRKQKRLLPQTFNDQTDSDSDPSSATSSTNNVPMRG
jgi:arylsulfatase A-like enzyme